MSEPLIIHSSDVVWETWEPESQIETRGRVYWKNLFCQGQTESDSLTLGLAIVHPNDALNPHRHEPSEIYYILQGEGVMTLGDQERTVRANDAVFIPGHLRHGIANKSIQDLVFVYAFARDSFHQVTYIFPEEKAASTP